MDKKNTLRFTFTIVAIILGTTLYKKFDFQTLQFENNRLAIVYGITFVFSVFYLIRNRKKPSSSDQ